MAKLSTKVSKHYDIREFVSSVVWDEWKLKSKWFVQARIINVCELLYRKISINYDIPISNIKIKINTWMQDGRKKGISDAGYRSGLDYLDPDGKPRTDIKLGVFDSFHRQGHCVNVCIEILKDEKTTYLSSYDITSVILDHENDFIVTGLTAISEPRKHSDCLHMDCRNTNSFNIKIVNVRD